MPTLKALITVPRVMATVVVVKLKWFALAGVCALGIFRVKRRILLVQL